MEHSIWLSSNSCLLLCSIPISQQYHFLFRHGDANCPACKRTYVGFSLLFSACKLTILSEDEGPATSEECGTSEGPVTFKHGALEGSVISKDCATSDAASTCFLFCFLVLTLCLPYFSCCFLALFSAFLAFSSCFFFLHVFFSSLLFLAFSFPFPQLVPSSSFPSFEAVLKIHRL